MSNRGTRNAPSLGVTILSGVLLGCAICLMELVEQPLSYVSADSVWTFLSALAPLWEITGLCWAFAARWAEPRFSFPALVTVTLIAASALTVAVGSFDDGAPIYEHEGGLSTDARLFHILWVNLFYGSLYMTGYVTSRRAVRSRRVLARVRQAREESAALLDESRLEAMRRQLQPQTTLDALDALRRLYRLDVGRADLLVNELVGFLRPAVRSLAGETSTLAGELDLARRYLHLRVLIGGGEIEAARADARPPPAGPFPSRLLMPAVESLCLSGARLRLVGAWSGDHYRVVLTSRGVPATELPRWLRRRIAEAGEPWTATFTSEFVEHGDRLSWVLTFFPTPRTRRLEMLACET